MRDILVTRTQLFLRRFAGAVVLGAVIAIALPASASASDGNGTMVPIGTPGGVAATPARIELGMTRDNPMVDVPVSVTNRGPQPTRVHAELRDLVVTQGGAYATVPAGQTPYSVSAVAQLDSEELNLDTNGAIGATGVIHLSGALDSLDRPRYGAVSLELEDPGAATLDFGGVRVAPQLRPSILIPVLFIPLAGSDAQSTAEAATPNGDATAHLAESISLQLQGLGLSVAQRDQNGLLDQVIPFGLPGVADHGPLLASTQVHNTGNAFGRAFTTFEFSGINPLGFLPESLRGAVGLEQRPFLQVQAPPAALMPDMLGETRAATTYAPQPGSEVDSTPWVGLVRVRATTNLVLADVASAPAVSDVYVLILPWKECLVGLGLWGAWRALRHWRGRRRKPADVLKIRAPGDSAEAA